MFRPLVALAMLGTIVTGCSTGTPDQAKAAADTAAQRPIKILAPVSSAGSDISWSQPAGLSPLSGAGHTAQSDVGPIGQALIKAGDAKLGYKTVVTTYQGVIVLTPKGTAASAGWECTRNASHYGPTSYCNVVIGKMATGDGATIEDHIVKFPCTPTANEIGAGMGTGPIVQTNWANDSDSVAFGAATTCHVMLDANNQPEPLKK